MTKKIDFLFDKNKKGPFFKRKTSEKSKSEVIFVRGYSGDYLQIPRQPEKETEDTAADVFGILSEQQPFTTEF